MYATKLFYRKILKQMSNLPSHIQMWTTFDLNLSKVCN